MRLLRHYRTLLFFEGVQIFEAIDAIGGHYLCLLVSSDNGVDEYLSVGASPENLRQFKTGELDLRTILLQQIIPEWFIIISSGNFKEAFEAQEQQGEIPERMLPLADFLCFCKKQRRERSGISG